MQKSLPTIVLIGALFALRMPCGAATPTLTTLFSFPGTEGAYPEAGLVLNNGALYGTTYAGGWAGARCLSCHRRRPRPRPGPRLSFTPSQAAPMARILGQVWSSARVE